MQPVQMVPDGPAAASGGDRGGRRGVIEVGDTRFTTHNLLHEIQITTRNSHLLHEVQICCTKFTFPSHQMVPNGPAAASGVIEVGDTLVPDGPVLSEYGTHLSMP